MFFLIPQGSDKDYARASGSGVINGFFTANPRV